MFYIKCLNITANHRESKITFAPGLNIIYGPSNTGKSMVLDCIDYLMGAPKHRFDTNLKMEKIQMELDVDGHNVYISREVDTQSFDVYSNVDGIEAGTYKIKGGKKNHAINEVWLKLMGLPADTKIIKTQEGKSQMLTIRTFYHTFLLDEDRVPNKSSIFKGKRGMGENVETSVLTALLYLATGNNYLPKDSFIDKNIKKAKDEGALKIVNRGMRLLEKQISSFDEKLPSLPPDELRNKINQTLTEIGAAKGTLKEALALCRETGEKINGVLRQLAEDEVLMNRNQMLLSQYKADIKRLTFILEGNFISKKMKPVKKCPFCNGELSPENEDNYIEAAIAEEQKIELQVKDLQSVQSSLQEEYNSLEETKTLYINRRNQQEEIIRGELKPKIQQLKEQLDEYRISLRFSAMNAMVDQFLTFFKQERAEVEKNEISTIHLDVKEKFKEIFKKLLDGELDRLLRWCDYQDYVDSYFDVKSCDVVINGHNKKSQDKGFRAFINTLLAIAMENCLKEMGHYSPALFVVDSPILTLKENELRGDEQITEPMKVHLFKYFLKRKDAPQTIIIENEIPQISYENANLIQFTKKKGVGRYGLISEYYEG